MPEGSARGADAAGLAQLSTAPSVLRERGGSFHSRGSSPSVSAEIAGAPVSEISGPFSTDDVASSCVPALPLHQPVLWVVSYTLMSVCGVILLVLIILLLLPFRCRHLPRDPEVVSDESSLVRHRWK